jgi:hypothetical protein
MAKTMVGVPEGGKKYKPQLDTSRNDPRSEIVTNADRAVSKIGVGTTVKVQGTKAMLAGKRKTATWF